MRHFTWAATWFVVGLAMTLGTASVLQQVVANRVPASVMPMPAPEPTPAPSVKPPSEGRDLLVASRQFKRYRAALDADQ
ncbi:MAG: hypothetical protein JSR24_13635 [Proteobacteria bacterium]|nr:hypothetical protein [Pseudomonadota bacterium]